MKIGALLESMKPKERLLILEETIQSWKEGEFKGDDSLTTDKVLSMFLNGLGQAVVFTPRLIGDLAKACVYIKGERSGYPHLCGATQKCGKHEDPKDFLEKARAQMRGGAEHVSAGYSAQKAQFIIQLVEAFESGTVTAEKIAAASDREAARMLLSLKGIGDWCAGSVLVHFLKRADVMLYGDVTIRNYLNDLYEIHHNDASETVLDSLADFPDNRENRNRIDALAQRNGWYPYRSLVGFLMYHLQEEQLFLL
jgi:hypothetical protein